MLFGLLNPSSVRQMLEPYKSYWATLNRPTPSQRRRRRSLFPGSERLELRIVPVTLQIASLPELTHTGQFFGRSDSGTTVGNQIMQNLVLDDPNVFPVAAESGFEFDANV